MSQFEGFNAENKLRIPLTAYAAQVIENDCMNFAKKRATLINSIILNYYQSAECSISLRLIDYKNELSNCFSYSEIKNNQPIIDKIISRKATELKELYAKRHTSDLNWQISLNKKVKELLTNDPNSFEEKYYGERPGHYVHSLIEEYAQLPYYRREEVIYKDFIDTINNAIDSGYVLNLLNTKGNHISLKPYKIATDPLSMYHYLVGYSIMPDSSLSVVSEKKLPDVLSIRLSRLTAVDIQYFNSSSITPKEERQINSELEKKGVQFVSGDVSSIKIWLSDNGIKKYNSQLHLRPAGTKDDLDNHIYLFECTEAQALFYFISFGKDARVIFPETLKNQFKEIYNEALTSYK